MSIKDEIDLEALAFKLHKMGSMERVKYHLRCLIEARIEELIAMKKEIFVTEGYSPGPMYGMGLNNAVEAVHSIIDKRITTLTAQLKELSE